MLGSFSNMTSVNEMSDKNNGQMFGGALAGGGDGGWGQGFSGNFPPLPEPGNTGSLVSLTSRSGQYAFNNQQQDFALSGNGFSSGTNQPVSSQLGGFGGQSGFSGQPAFGGQPGFGGQPAFGNGGNGGNNGNGGNGGNQPFFGNQADFGDLNGFDSSQLGANGGGFSGQQYGANSGFTPQGQQYYQSTNPGFMPQNPNSNLLPTPPNQQPKQPGQSAPARPRWQQDQNQ